MATPRNTGGIRATRIRGESGSDAGPAPAAEQIEDPREPREVIDHTLERRQAIADIRRTGGFNYDATPDPYLLRAAKHYGVPNTRPCPICAESQMVDLIYVYGREMGYSSGRARHPRELHVLAHEYGFLRVFNLEVCQSCGWNHIMLSYMIGDGIPRKPARKPRGLVN